MPRPSGIHAILLALPLLAAAAPRSAEDGEFAPGTRYVVETGEGGIFTSEITGSDADSLYFVDGSALPRAEVATVRRQGEWAGQRTLHPGPETEPGGATVEVGDNAFLTLADALLSLLIAVFD